MRERGFRPSEHHDAADRLPGFERGEAGVDLVERDVAGDQLVELQPAVETGAG